MPCRGEADKVPEYLENTDFAMPTVSAAEFVRNFGTYQRTVQREPVEVTSHGKLAGVYVSPEDADLLRRIKSGRIAFTPEEATPDLADAIRDARPAQESRALDHLME